MSDDADVQKALAYVDKLDGPVHKEVDASPSCGDEMARVLAAEVRRVRSIEDAQYDEAIGRYIVPVPDRDELVFFPAGPGGPLSLNNDDDLHEITDPREQVMLRALIGFVADRLDERSDGAP